MGLKYLVTDDSSVSVETQTKGGVSAGLCWDSHVIG